MGPLLTPTTELFYAFVNLDDTPVPRDLPEEDVFARAFEQATVIQPRPSKNDLDTSADLDSPDDSPIDIIFDDFPSRDLDESGETSPSSGTSSSAKTLINASKYVTTSFNCPPARSGEYFDGSSAALEQAASYLSRPNVAANGVGILENPQIYGPVAGNNGPFLPAANFVAYPKQPRRRNTKRKLRTEEEEALRRTAFLERNRMAAQKCRSRKKRQTNTLEDDLAVQEEINMRLKGQVADLVAELKSLKEVYMQCEQECQHAKVGGEASKEVQQEVEVEVEVEVEFEVAKAKEDDPEPVISPAPKDETVEAMDVL